MSIASEITRINNNIASAYTACNNKGATMPVTQNSANLATCINSISGGGGGSPVITSLNVTPTTSAQTITAPQGTDGYSPVNVSAVTSAIDQNITQSNIKSGVTILGVTGNYTGSATLITKNITQNGTYNASSDNADGYSSVTVNVSGGGGTGITREVSATGVYQMPTTSFTFSLPSNATDLGQYAMYYAFRNCTSLTSVDLSSLTTVSGSNAMQYAFNSCTGLTSVDLSSLTTVSGSNAMASAFRQTALTTLSFPALTSTSFGSYTNQFNSMLQGVTGCTVHFPRNLQSVIGSWSSVTSGFGGTRTTVLFDLPATT